MNRLTYRLFSLGLPAFLLLAGCQKAPAFLPVTGSNQPAVPVQVEQARDNVLEYVLSSESLAALPQDMDWQLEAGKQSQGKYRYRSGEWIMLIWLADAQDGNRRVIIVNQADHSSWRGYVTAGGDVVDTSHAH